MKHFSHGLWMVLGLCLGFLAACDDAPRSVVTFRLDDVWTFAQGAMVAGPLPVDIRGRPHGDDDLARNDAVIGAMTQAITWTANPRFTADGSASLRSAIRVVVTFNGTGGVGGGEQCRGVSTGGGPLPDGEIRIAATFCDGEDMLANVRGRVARTGGTDDPRFSRLIRQVTRDMFADTNDR